MRAEEFYEELWLEPNSNTEREFAAENHRLRFKLTIEHYSGIYTYNIIQLETVPGRESITAGMVV